MKWLTFYSILLLVAGCLETSASPAPPKCGYDSCLIGKPEMLNVHLVCHSHDDVGWLKTVDQYYYGAHSEIQRAGVQYILDSVVDQLVKDKNKRFIYVETAFFWRWWSEQTDVTKETVRTLVNESRLEFIGGGWSMNDEACTHYNAIIDQMTLGFKMLHDNFGECGRPRVAWQIDPFGHSKEQASLFAQMGFDGLFFGRLDHADKKKRLANKTMEMVWMANPSLNESSWLFTGALFNNYNPPPGFCFDVLCDDEPFMDNPRMANYNVEKKVSEFVNHVEKQAENFTTNHIILTMGEDFNYQNANMWYSNLDKLIRYVNARQENGSKVNVFYSTPTCYLKALHDSPNKWPVFDADFLPYSSDPHAYWTGYYTSRPSQKGMIRTSNNFLQVCKQMSALGRPHTNHQPEVEVMRQAMAVNQHHDAVTGTEKQQVAFDYYMRLSKGADACEKVVSKAYSVMMPKLGTESYPGSQQFCRLLNISQCKVTEENSRFVVSVYNPLARRVSLTVRLPVRVTTYTVYDFSGEVMEAQIMPVPKPVLKVPGRDSSAIYELIFRAFELPPVGFKSYYVVQKASKKTWHSSVIRSSSTPVSIANEDVFVDFDNYTGLMSSITMNGLDLKVTQSILAYHGMAGNNSKAEYRASGAYIFRPNGAVAHPVASQIESIERLEGPLVQEVRQTFCPWVSQVVRLNQGEDVVEMEWLIGPIPVDDGIGKEVISRFSTDLMTNKFFYTDSNGRQMMLRERNVRENWLLDVTEPVAGNYYPVNSRIAVIDSEEVTQLTVLTDRTQGGSSIDDGDLELMIHRRLLYDDAFGVDEALNEEAYGVGLVVRGKHWVAVSPQSNATRIHRDLAERIFLAPWLSFVPTTDSLDDWKGKYYTEYSAMKAELPENIHLLTLEQWDSERLLLRLEHTFAVGEDPEFSKPVSVLLTHLFRPFTITSVEEMSLGVNQAKKDMSRFTWNVTHPSAFQNFADNEIPELPRYPNDFVVNLMPMEIKSFLVKVHWMKPGSDE